MPSFRTSTGLVDVAPQMRIASGLVPASAIFYGASGPVNAGGATALAATVDPTDIYGAGASNGSVRVYSSFATVTATGGTPPYTYSWGSVASWTVSYPTAAATDFSHNVSPNNSFTAIFTCTVTDSKGATVAPTVSVTVENFGGYA